MMDDRQKAYNKRDRIRTLSLAEAKALGGMLGLICEAALLEKGWYSYTMNGKNVFVTLKA